MTTLSSAYTFGILSLKFSFSEKATKMSSQNPPFLTLSPLLVVFLLGEIGNFDPLPSRRHNLWMAPYGFDIYSIKIKTIRLIAQIFGTFSEKVNFKDLF